MLAYRAILMSALYSINLLSLLRKHPVAGQLSFSQLFIAHHQSANSVCLRYSSWRLQNDTRPHWSPSTGKPHMIPVSFVKTAESYDESYQVYRLDHHLDSINRT